MSDFRPLTDFVDVNPPLNGRSVRPNDDISFGCNRPSAQAEVVKCEGFA
jgi:hypothetical protein